MGRVALLVPRLFVIDPKTLSVSLLHFLGYPSDAPRAASAAVSLFADLTICTTLRDLAPRKPSARNKPPHWPAEQVVSPRATLAASAGYLFPCICGNGKRCG